MEPDDAVKMIQDKFQGRIIDPKAGVSAEGQKWTPPRVQGEAQPVKMFKCQGENPGCGLSKPADEFYKEFATLCSECALKTARKHGAELTWIPLILHCYEITRKIRAECEAAATKEGREAAWSKLVAGSEIEIGRSHFVASMIAGTQKAPRETEWVMDLFSRYKAWMMKYYAIPNSANETTKESGS